MSVPASLLPELEEVVQYGSAEKRAETLRRITSLFLDGAPSFNEDHVALFDDVIGCLIKEIEVKALASMTPRVAKRVRYAVSDRIGKTKIEDLAINFIVFKQDR